MTLLYILVITLAVIVAVLCLIVWALLGGHNVTAKRLVAVERTLALHDGHLRNHAKQLQDRPAILRGPKIGGRR